MFLHAAHASQQGYETIVIKFPDTNRGVPAVYYIRKISGSPILETCISQKYGENICEALLGLHAFTGCESVSAFSEKGKQFAIN